MDGGQKPGSFLVASDDELVFSFLIFYIFLLWNIINRIFSL